MAASSEFSGFSKDLPKFLGQLKKNNSKAWFDEHRKDYEALFLEPAKQFVAAIADPLKGVSKAIQVEPRVNGSIMRINRDIRFSKDKTPYKTTLDMMFWEGASSRESPCFFLRMTSTELILGAGMHMFGSDQLKTYRQALLNNKIGGVISRTVAGLSDKGYEVGGEHYKKVPRGFDADHPRADLLRHNALWAATTSKIPAAMYGKGGAAHCAKTFATMRPVQKWLVQIFYA